jgi:hypothetical protein
MAFTALSKIYKKARHGGDIGKKNVPGKTGFKAVQAKAAAKYGSEEAGERVAGKIMHKVAKKLAKGK